jgi:hypothetical protein
VGEPIGTDLLWSDSQATQRHIVGLKPFQLDTSIKFQTKVISKALCFILYSKCCCVLVLLDALQEDNIVAEFKEAAGTLELIAFYAHYWGHALSKYPNTHF